MSTMPVPYDDLPTDPYSAYPPVDLTKVKYPETLDNSPNSPRATWGLGIERLFPVGIAIEAWNDLNIGDYYGCRWRDLNNPIASDFVKELLPRYHLFIDGKKLPEGISPMFCRVVRAGSRNESRSATQWVLIKTTRPGGEDRKEWEPWHSELRLSVEGLEPGSIIDADTFSGGIYCLIENYENRSRNDVITIDWGGITFEYTVSPLEASGTKALRIRVPDGKNEDGTANPALKNVLNEGPQRGPFEVRFKVVDVVGNTSGGKYHFSKGFPLLSNLDPKLLPAPSFKVNGLDEFEADLDQQERPLFQLTTFPPRAAKKPVPLNKVRASLRIFSEDNVLIESVDLGEIPDTNGGVETFNVAYEHVAKAAGGRFTAFYTVSNAAGTKTSGSTFVRVLGTATHMPAPDISPIEGTLMPLDKDAIVKIPEYFPFYKTGREMVVFAQGEPGEGGLLYTDTRLAGEQGGVRDVLKENLKIFQDKGLFQVHYIVNNGMNLPSSIRHSEKRSAELGVRAVEIPAPVVTYAEDGNIDPKNVKRSILLMSFPYIGATPGCTLVWNAIGADYDSSDSGSILIDSSTEGHLLPELLVELKKEVVLGNVDGEVSFSYSVQRAGAANKPKVYTRSEVLNLTVGPKVVMDTPIVVEANKLLQDEVHPKDVLNGATVQVNYSSMRKTDDIIVSWAGEFGISIIEVHAKGNPLTNSVDVRIPPHIIALGIREGGNNITVQYRFSRGNRTYTSKPLAIRLKLVTALPAPTINGIKDALFPLLALGNEVKIEVDRWILIQRNQRKFLTIEGTNADGTALRETVYLADNVTDDEVANGVAFTLAGDTLRALKEDSVLRVMFGVSYAQRDEPETAVPFGKREYRVLAVPASLPAPAFDNKPGATLSVSPLNYLQGSFISVKYSGMTTAQTITCELLYPDGTVADIAPQKGVAAGRVDVTISAQVIAMLVNKTATLRYKVTTGTKEVWSEPQILTVGTIPAENFPMALINVAPDKGEQNLATFAGNATLTLAKWLLIFAGQKVWITCRSVGTAQLAVLTAYEVTSADVTKGLVNIPVSRPWLEGLTNNFKVEVLVTLDKSTNIENAVVFRLTDYTVKGQLRIAQQAMYLNGVSIKEFPAARTTAESFGNVQYRVASGGAGGYAYSSNNPRVASVDASGKVTGNANGSATITALDRNGTKTSYAVYVSNVYRLLYTNTPLNFGQAWAWAASVGGAYMFDAAIYDIARNYINGTNFLVGRWAYSGGGCPAYWVTYYDNANGIYCRYLTETHPVMCLQPVY